MKGKSKEKKSLATAQAGDLLAVLKKRFDKNMKRHKDLDWNKIESRLLAAPEKLWTLHEMEKSGGEPDVVGYDKKTGEYVFCDC